jgi:hypothetical protein
MKTRSTIGLAIIAGGLSFVGTANAIDLILNGSFEAVTGGSSAYNCHTDGTLAGWDGTISCIAYGYNYFSGPVIPASENPGSAYSWNQDGDPGHSSGYTNALTQTVNLTAGASAANIDLGRGQYTFSAWMASYTLQDDQPYLTLSFFDAGSNQVGATAVLDRVHSLFFTTFADGTTVFDSTAHLHDWAKYVKTAAIPPLARTALVGIQHSPNGTLTGRPDTYVDLVKLDVIEANTRPSLDSASPLDSQLMLGDSGIPANTSINVTLRDGFYAVNTNTIVFSLDGTARTPVISKAGPITTIQYTPALLASGSSHTYQVSYGDTGPGLPQTNALSFTVANYATLPAAYASPPGSGSHPGFTFRSVSAYSQVITAPTNANTIARAVAQLNGTLINPDTSTPYTNEATPGTNADGSFNIEGVVDFNDNFFGFAYAGDFTNDSPFPGLDAGPYDWFSCEGLFFLDLPAGYYRFGVNSDDGFEFNALPPKGVPGSSIALGLFDNGRGASDTLYDFQVTTAGVYPFQLIYFESQGGASLELFSVDTATTRKILINDLGTTGAIKSFLVVPPRITSIVRSGSNVSISWAYGNPPFQVQFKNNIIGPWNNSGAPTSNRTALVPIQPGTGFIRIVGSP